MDVPDSPLVRAARLCAADVGCPCGDVLECLEGDDWEMALLLLEELGDARPQPPAFWSLLAEAARQMWLHRDAEWCAWRCGEARNGAVLAELCLVSRAEGGRMSPVPAARGGLRPMWDIGRVTPEGEPLLHIAALWVEGRDALEPGKCGPVRLQPMAFDHWRHLVPGDAITMYERRPPAGTARVIEVVPPFGGT